MAPIEASEPQATGRLRPPALSLLLAEMMTGETPFADARPFAVERFG